MSEVVNVLLAVEARDKASQIFEKLDSNLQKLSGHFKQAGTDAESAASSEAGAAEKESSAFGRVSKAATMAGLAITAAAAGIAVESVKAAIAYQQSTASIAAHAGTSVAAAQKVSNAFLSTAGSTTFSAQTMANAFAPVAGEFVTMYGHALSAGQALTVMKDASDLAEASGSNLNDTTKALADTMLVFHLNTSQASKAGDDLWNTSKAMGVGVSDLATQMQRLEPRIVGSGMNLQQLSGFMVELAHSAGSGRQAMRLAGTAIQGLLTPSTTAQKLMAKMGLSFTTASGQFIGFQGALGEVSQVINSQTVPAAQKAALMYDLFGRNANTMQAMVAAGVPGLEKAAETTGKVGTAATAASQQSNTFKGQMEKLHAALEDTAVTIGQALLPVIMKIVDVVMPVIRAVAQWINQHRQLAAVILVVVGAIGALVAIIGVVSAVISAFSAMSVLMNPWVLAIVAIIAVLVLIATHWKQVSAVVRTVVGDIVGFFTGLWSDITKIFTTLFAWLKKNWMLVVGIILGPVGLAIDAVVAIVTHFKQIWHAVTSAIGGFIHTFILGPIGAIVNAVRTAIGWISKLPKMLSNVPVLGGLMGGIGKAAGGIGGFLGHIFQTGGIVTGPTMGLLGEAGPEAVIPLSQLQTLVPALAGGGGSGHGAGGGNMLYVDLRGSQVMSDRDLDNLTQKIGYSLATRYLPGAGVYTRR